MIFLLQTIKENITLSFYTIYKQIHTNIITNLNFKILDFFVFRTYSRMLLRELWICRCTLYIRNRAARSLHVIHMCEIYICAALCVGLLGNIMIERPMWWSGKVDRSRANSGLRDGLKAAQRWSFYLRKT